MHAECSRMHAFWNILEILHACILEHSACILEHSACIMEHFAFILEHSGTSACMHSGTFCMHSGTFWNFCMHAFWNILELSGTLTPCMHACMHSGTFWNFLEL